jgi:Type VI secretion system, TssO
MPPTNVQARRKAFINFLILFFISAGIIITTFFFSIRVPFRQNAQLRQQVNANEKEKDFSKKFTTRMFSITSMLDSFSNKLNNAEILSNTITARINELSTMVESDSVYNKDLYRNIVLSLSTLRDTKKELKDNVNKGTNTIQQTTNQNEVLQSKWDLANLKFKSIEQLVNTYRPQLPADFINQIMPQLQP